jgi:hypothetical protein
VVAANASARATKVEITMPAKTQEYAPLTIIMPGAMVGFCVPCPAAQIYSLSSSRYEMPLDMLGTLIEGGVRH